LIIYNVENEKNEDLNLNRFSDELQKFKIPFSSIFKTNRDNDIYTGNEKIPFKDRHPTYKALLKLEFEEAIKIWILSNS
jgi:hypothetical protein